VPTHLVTSRSRIRSKAAREPLVNVLHPTLVWGICLTDLFLELHATFPYSLFRAPHSNSRHSPCSSSRYFMMLAFEIPFVLLLFHATQPLPTLRLACPARWWWGTWTGRSSNAEKRRWNKRGWRMSEVSCLSFKWGRDDLICVLYSRVWHPVPYRGASWVSLSGSGRCFRSNTFPRLKFVKYLLRSIGLPT